MWGVEGFYTAEGYLTTATLLESESPLRGVEVKAEGEGDIRIEVGFTSADGPFVQGDKLSENGLLFTAFSSDASETEITYTAPLSPKEAFGQVTGQRFWTLPVDGSNADQRANQTEVRVGSGQWFVEFKQAYHGALDYVYKTPLLSDWDSDYLNAALSFGGGVVFGPDTLTPLSGDIKSAWAWPPTTGVGFLGRNLYTYTGETASTHLFVAAGTPSGSLIQAGRQYRLSTWVHCQSEAQISVDMETAGAENDGGALCATLCVNEKEALSAGDRTLFGQSWAKVSGTIGLRAGWNLVQLLLYRPDTSKETSPSGYSGLRINFNPLDPSLQERYNITQSRFIRDSLTKTDEFDLKVLGSPGTRKNWAWRESDPQYILLGHSWNHDLTDVITDGLSEGEGAIFTVRYRQAGSGAPAVWIRATLTGDGENTPSLRHLSVRPL